ncbi:MAG: 7-cyano-7-deazaguanine synthase QueC [Phycisphaerales bacterium]
MLNDTSPPLPRAVVLLSGGLDSATALALAVRAGTPCVSLSVDYSQRHRAELDAARAVARSLGVARHVIVPLDLRPVGGSALTADIDVPKDRLGGSPALADIPLTYVPARNMLLLSLAVGLAEVVGADQVHIGVNQIDYSGYPDCREEFIRAFEHAARLGTKAGTADARPIRIVAPLVHMTKRQIIEAGQDAGLDFSLTLSCYDPVRRDGEVLACGRCDSCHLRREGFREARLSDPTRYAS